MKTKTHIILAIFIIATALVFIFTRSVKQLSPSTTNIIDYSCDSGKSIHAVFTESGQTITQSEDMPPIPTGTAVVTLSDGRTLDLKQTISADGVRYANSDESFVFWGKGNSVLVLENDVEKDYQGCIMVAPKTASSNLPQIYSNSKMGFSLRLPADYKIDSSKYYQGLGQRQDISGVKFTIPSTVASGTNLSNDSYLSVEEIPTTQMCDASLFTYKGVATSTLLENNVEYSIASTSDAGAGNRYEESIYALPGNNPCIAVRYLVHYSVFENYPAGMVKQFDKQSLLNQFNQIRRTLVVE